VVIKVMKHVRSRRVAEITAVAGEIPDWKLATRQHPEERPGILKAFEGNSEKSGEREKRGFLELSPTGLITRRMVDLY
jgi:hypothetical protein